MAMKAIFDASLYINNEVVAYEPNSLMAVSGKGERTVSPQVVGNGATENVVAENVETKKGKVSFDVRSTIENKILVRRFQSNFDTNVIRLVYSDGTSSVFQQAVVINDPEFDLGSDGVAKIEFESLPEVLG
jgi:hypothetical protein